MGDREVELANKEFELLYFLASNPNIVFSKDTLFDRIWGMDAIGDTATVAVHINRIREKIGPDEETLKLIETVWEPDTGSARNKNGSKFPGGREKEL